MSTSVRRAARWVALLSLSLAFAHPAHAGVVLDNTRVVFPGDARDVTVRLSNRHAHPVLVEAWVESPSPTAQIPFAPDPPLFRIDPGKGQTLRLHRLPGALARDRETLFWFNVLDVPPDPSAETDASSMKIALRTRIKLLHRPSGLVGSPTRAPAALLWRVLDDARLEIDNPTPYHVTIARIADPEGWDVLGEMVAPFASIIVRRKVAPGSGRIVFEAINDLGGRDRFEAMLSDTPAR